MAASIVAIVDDLFFLAKIRETAKAVGITVTTIPAGGGAEAVASAQPRAIILDLNFRGTPAVRWIQELKSNPATAPIRITGFVSHVQEDLISAAKVAGCDTVLARSAFTQQLPAFLRSLLAESSEASR